MMIRNIIASTLLICGVINILIAIIGTFEFKFVLNRMHSAAIIDSMGFLFVMAGLMLISTDFVFLTKAFLVLLFQWVGSPIASHMVARLEIETDDNAKKHMHKGKR